MLNIDLYCPTCSALPGALCTTGQGTNTRTFHKARKQFEGYTGRLRNGKQRCNGCGQWKWPHMHSCPGVPQSTIVIISNELEEDNDSGAE